jgi:hypothetical protein
MLCHFTCKDGAHIFLQMRGWIFSRAGLDAMEKRKYLALSGNLTPIP